MRNGQHQGKAITSQLGWHPAETPLYAANLNKTIISTIFLANLTCNVFIASNVLSFSELLFYYFILLNITIK